MEELVEVIARNIVDQPEKVTTNKIEDGNTTVVELSVADDDMGKVIGKQGRIARAIRKVVKASATKEGKKVEVKIK
ncbi:MAG TPA: KH domain-containing protein [Halanaerobiales bacterium]|nr:KH domain-containing protein [Halanaerobiales bacterium]